MSKIEWQKVQDEKKKEDPLLVVGGADLDRQAQLDQTLGTPPLEPHVVAAKKPFIAGKISLDTFWERVFKKRNV